MSGYTDEAERILEAERARAGAPEGARAAIREKLSAYVAERAAHAGTAHAGTAAAPRTASNGTGAGPRPAGRAGFAKLLAPFGLTLVAGAMLGAFAQRTWGPPRVVPVLAAHASAAPVPLLAPVDATPSPLATPGPAPPPAAPVAQAPVAQAPEKAAALAQGPLDRERTLVDRARSALARGDTDACMRAIREHAASYPDGVLAEEREVTAIRALAASGHDVDARARARAFHDAYPASLFGASVDAVVRPP